MEKHELILRFRRSNLPCSILDWRTPAGWPTKFIGRHLNHSKPIRTIGNLHAYASRMIVLFWGLGLKPEPSSQGPNAHGSWGHTLARPPTPTPQPLPPSCPPPPDQTHVAKGQPRPGSPLPHPNHHKRPAANNSSG